MVGMADTDGSNPSARERVQVRLLPRALMYEVSPEMAAMYNIPNYEPEPEPLDIDKAIRYCHACSSCEICVAADGCWLCGGPVTRDKPPYWPPRICATNVTQGEAFTPGEEPCTS